MEGRPAAVNDVVQASTTKNVSGTVSGIFCELYSCLVRKVAAIKVQRSTALICREKI